MNEQMTMGSQGTRLLDLYFLTSEECSRGPRASQGINMAHLPGEPVLEGLRTYILPYSVTFIMGKNANMHTF